MKADRCVARGLEMTDLSLRVSLARGLADVRDITFSAYGGRARGTVTLAPFEPRVPFSLEETAEDVAIGPLIAALAPAQKGTVEGRAKLFVRLSGDAGGAAMLPTVNGAGQVAIEAGKIASVGVIKQVMSLLEIAGAKGVAKDETPFDRLSANFDVKAGTAATNDLVFRSPDLDGDGAGTVGLGGAVKIDLLASFAKAISDQLVAKTHALSIRRGAGRPADRAAPDPWDDSRPADSARPAEGHPGRRAEATEGAGDEEPPETALGALTWRKSTFI